MSVVDLSVSESGDSPTTVENRSVSETTVNENLFGIWAPCLTPVRPDYSIDSGRLLEHVSWLLSNGCDGVVLFGTTGEAASFSALERMHELETLVAGGIPHHQIMVGNGFTALSDSVQVTRHAAELGCRKLLMMPPFYFKEPPLTGLVSHYRHVLDAIDCPDIRVLLYHFPRMSQVPITFDLIDALIDSHGSMIAGLKDSSGQWNSVEEYARKYPNLAIFPGTDTLLLQGLKSGCAGTISATADINPHGIRRVLESWRRGDRAEDEQKEANAIRQIVARFPLAPALKTVHATLRSDPDWYRLRPPLVPLGDREKIALMDSLSQVGFGFEGVL